MVTETNSNSNSNSNSNISVTPFGAIEWRNSEIQDVVDFLNVVNPKGYTVEEIKRHALNNFDGNPTFIGTAGWYVTIVRKNYEAEIPFIALVSVMGFTAKKGLETLERELKEEERENQKRTADRIDGYDRDDIGESEDY